MNSQRSQTDSQIFFLSLVVLAASLTFGRVMVEIFNTNMQEARSHDHTISE